MKTAPALVDLLIPIGFPYSRSLTCLDAPTADGGSPVDITGYTAYAQVKDKDENFLLNLSPVVSDPTNGKITLSVAKAVTDLLTPGIHRWDLVILDASGNALPLICQGKVEFRKTVTEIL